jgi:hypothetical protein
MVKALIGARDARRGAPPATPGGAVNEALMAEVTVWQARSPEPGVDARRRKQVPEGFAQRFRQLTHLACNP